jgi:hypothetical protein
MTYPFTVAEIVSWYRSKQNTIGSSGVSLVSIREAGEHLPVAVADFDGADAMGRISGWVSGDFDFEVVRVSDGKDLFWGHVHASGIDALEAKYLDFLTHLQSPEVAVAD